MYDLQEVNPGFDKSLAHIANDKRAEVSNSIDEVLRDSEAKIVCRHDGVKRRCCEARSAYCVTGVPNNSRHCAPLQWNTWTLGKVTG